MSTAIAPAIAQPVFLPVQPIKPGIVCIEYIDPRSGIVREGLMA